MADKCRMPGCDKPALQGGKYCRQCGKPLGGVRVREEERRVPSHLQYDGKWDDITKAYEEDR